MKKTKSFRLFCSFSLVAMLILVLSCSKPAPQVMEKITVDGKEVTFALREVPAGKFIINKTNWANKAGTLLTMTITKPYLMAETEVTRELWEAVMQTDPNFFQRTLANNEVKGEDQTKLPETTITWHQAIAFCNKLSLITGLTPVYSVKVDDVEVDWKNLVYKDIPRVSDNKEWNSPEVDWSANGYRLPTEMEWMWAAMGADSAKQGKVNETGYQKAFAGDKIPASKALDEYVWHKGNSDKKTHQVGLKKTNELGLFDMSGNGNEWCWDRYEAYPGDEIDYTGHAAAFYRVVRGGSVHSFNGADDCTVSSRSSGAPNNGSYGFRIVRNK